MDSLVDVVVYLLAPTVFVFLALEDIGWFAVAGLTFMCTCGTLRLAWFSIDMTQTKGKYNGLPVPGNMGVLFMWTLELSTGVYIPDILICALCIIVGLLNISNVQFTRIFYEQSLLRVLFIALCANNVFLFVYVLETSGFDPFWNFYFFITGLGIFLSCLAYVLFAIFKRIKGSKKSKS